jgi:hypothetical protein
LPYYALRTETAALISLGIPKISSFPQIQTNRPQPEGALTSGAAYPDFAALNPVYKAVTLLLL